MEILMRERELGYTKENVWAINVKSMKEIISLHYVFEERKHDSEVHFKLRDGNGEWMKLMEFIFKCFPDVIENNLQNNLPKIKYFNFKEEPRKNEEIAFYLGETEMILLLSRQRLKQLTIIITIVSMTMIVMLRISVAPLSIQMMKEESWNNWKKSNR